MNASPTVARLRGIASGLVTAALAIAAHGVADGVAPSGTAVALLAVLAATAGGLATTVPRAADMRALLGLLATAQILGHLMLSAAGHGHGQPSTPGSAMLAAHAAAVVAGAALIAVGDRLCRAISRVVRVAARPIIAPVPARPCVAADGDHPQRSTLLLAASVSHRGPPASHAR